MTLDNYEVLLTQPDFASPPRLVGKRGIRMLAKGQARRLGIFPTGGTQHVLNHRFAFTSRTEAKAMEDFFNARRGAWGAFFVPGWHAELEPLQTLAPGNTTLAVTAVNFAAVYLDAAKKTQTGRYIYLLNEDGDFHATKVLSATAGTPEILTIRDAIADNFILGKYHVGFLYFARFMGDRLMLDYSGPDFAACELPMIELVEDNAVVADEVTVGEPAGPTGGVNSESGSSGSAFWLRVECPITSPPNGCPATAEAQITLPSDIGGPRPVSIRIRGVAETKNHTGGTADSPFYIGGSPEGGGQNMLRLTVGSQVFYLNNALTDFGPNLVALLDYTRTVTMQAGDVITLEYDSIDLLEFHNGGTYAAGIWSKDGTTLLISDIPPGATGFNGQFVQVDFTL